MYILCVNNLDSHLNQHGFWSVEFPTVEFPATITLSFGWPRIIMIALWASLCLVIRACIYRLYLINDSPVLGQKREECLPPIEPFNKQEAMLRPGRISLIFFNPKAGRIWTSFEIRLGCTRRTFEGNSQ